MIASSVSLGRDTRASGLSLPVLGFLKASAHVMWSLALCRAHSMPVAMQSLYRQWSQSKLQLSISPPSVHALRQ